MTEEKNVRVALLIDADNVSPKHASDIFKAAAAHGHVIVRKTYGGINNGFAWPKESVFKYAIETVARYSYVRGKNIADIALVIDAMELMRRELVDIVCLASNDSDFSLLAMKLRENGIKVYGFGESKAQAAFVASCDGFAYLADTSAEKETPKKADPKPPLQSSAAKATVAEPKEKTPPKLPPKIKTAFSDAYDNSGGEDGGWVNLGAVGNYLLRINPAFSPKTYGFPKLTDLAESIGEFEIERDTGTSPRIRKKD